MAEVMARAGAAPVKPESAQQMKQEVVQRGQPHTARPVRPERVQQGRPRIVQTAAQVGRWWLRYWLKYAEAVGAQWR